MRSTHIIFPEETITYRRVYVCDVNNYDGDDEGSNFRMAISNQRTKFK